MKKVVYFRSTSIFNDSRAYKEINALLEAGYFVYVFCWNRDFANEDEVIHLFNSKNIVIRFFYRKNDSNTVLKIINRILFSIWIYKESINICRKAYALHSCDLDTGVAAMILHANSNVNLVYDIYDYYADSHNFNMLILKVLKKLENKVISNSDCTIVCTEERIQQIEDATPKKIAVIHNTPELYGIEKVENVYDYCYCGSLSNDRLISEILDNYKKYKNMKFIFAGYGPQVDKCKDNDNLCINFSFLGSIDYKKVLDIENKTRILSAVYNPKIKNNRFAAPNKFYEALALGKPIIVCSGTGIDEIVRKNRIGIVIDYNVDEFYNALKYLIDNPKECEKMGKRSKELYFEKYRWSTMKERLINIYDCFQ